GDPATLRAGLCRTMPYVYLRSFARSVRWDKRICWIGWNVIFTIVLIFTYSRAAILSLVVSAALYFLIRLKIPFRYLIFSGILAAGILWWNQEALIATYGSNPAESREGDVENNESNSSISTDGGY